MAKEKEHVMQHLGKDKPAGKKHEKKLHTHEMHIKRADHGGHIVHHHMRDEDGNEAGTQTAVVPDNEALGQHVQDAMGDQPAAGEGAPPQTAPDPAAAAGGAPGGMGQ